MLRERGWEGLPPPPTFTTEKPKPTDANQKGPTATSLITVPDPSNGDPKPRILQPLPEPATDPEMDTTPTSSVAHITGSPSISIATLSDTFSDFTIVDTPDDDSLIDPTVADTSDPESPIDPTA